MVIVLPLLIELLVILGVASATARLAALRDRAAPLWAGLTLAAAAAVAVGSWYVLVSADGGKGSDGLVLAGAAVLIAPVAAAMAVMAVLSRLPPGAASIPGAVAVRWPGAAGGGTLTVWQGELCLYSDGGETRIPRTELATVIPDGEVLCLTLRAGGEPLRLHVVEHDDPARRRRLCDALAAALHGPPPVARVERLR